MTDTYLSARTVAQLLDIKVGTLAKRRRLGIGPFGWKRESSNRVLYLKASVDEHLAALPTEARPKPASLANLQKRGGK